MGCLGRFAVYMVLLALTAGLVLNLAVVASCEYLKAKDHDVQLGVFRFSVNDASQAQNTTQYNTNGECREYTNAEEKVEWQVEMARVCAVIAPVCGAILILLVLVTQCCCPTPCSSPIITMAYIGVHLGTAFVWLVGNNDLCKNYLGGCDWGDAAWCNLFAQIAYLAAAFLHRLLPDPKLAAETRRADNAEAELKKQQDQNVGGNQPVPNSPAETANNAGTNAEVQQLQAELESQRQAALAAENRAVSAESRANTLQTQNDTQTADLEQQRNLLAAATAATGTAAAAEAAKIKKLNDETAQKDKELEQKVKELEDTNKELTEAKEDAEQQRNALAAATAATGTAATAESAQIKKLKNKLKAQEDEYKAQAEELKKSHDLCEEQKAALAVATGVTTATTTAEAIKIKELQDKINEQNEELEAFKQGSPAVLDSGNAKAVPPEDVEVVPVQQEGDFEMNEIRAKYEAQIEELEEENKVLKGLAVAGGAGTAVAGPEAAEIQELKKQVEDSEMKLKELQGDGDDMPVFVASNSDAADPDGTSSAEEQKLHNLQVQMDTQKEEYEAIIKDLEEQNAAGAVAAEEAVELKELKEELERQKKELKLIKAGGVGSPEASVEEAEKEDPPMDPPTAKPDASEPSGVRGSITGSAAAAPSDKEAEDQDEMQKLKDDLEQQKEEIPRMKAATEQAEDPPVKNPDVSQPGGVRGSIVGAPDVDGKEAEIQQLNDELARLRAELAEAKGEDPPVVNADVAQPGGVRGSVIGKEVESPAQGVEVDEAVPLSEDP